MARSRPRTYSPEFKAEAVRLVRTDAAPLTAIARDLGVTAWSLRMSAKAASGPSDPPLKEAERVEWQRLRREVRERRMERDILKKSDGLLRQAQRVRFAVIAAEKATYPVAALCRT